MHDFGDTAVVGKNGIGSARCQEAWERIASTMTAQLQLEVLDGVPGISSKSSKKQRQILPDCPGRLEQLPKCREDKSQHATHCKDASPEPIQDFEPSCAEVEDAGIACSAFCEIGSIAKTSVATSDSDNPRCLNETWERALRMLTQWLCTSSENAEGNLLIGLQNSGLCNKEHDFNGCESLRLLLTCTTVVRLEPVDWRAALETAYGRPFARLVEGVSRKSLEDNAPFQIVCRALARSPMDLSSWHSPFGLAEHPRSSEVEIAMLRPFLSESVQIKVAPKKSTFVTFAKSVDVAAAVTISLHHIVRISCEPHLLMTLACDNKCHEKTLEVNGGRLTWVVPEAGLILHFGNPYLSDGEVTGAPIELSLLPFRFFIPQSL